MPYKHLIFLLFFYSPLALGKYQVCSITINSADEIETFKKFLSTKDFNFVELLPAKVNPAEGHDASWFKHACKRTDIQCDILIVSGHFGGIFFGDSGYILSTGMLEEMACQNKCPGILSNVKEIFLFGCNTLASKEKDSRTYQEYLQVLLDHGMAREDAERVVASRYSPLGTPFYARMNFIFSSANEEEYLKFLLDKGMSKEDIERAAASRYTTVYGFNELSPLGPHIRKPLSNYLKAINQKFGSYANYLKSEQYKRLPRNQELFDNLAPSSLNQSQISLANESPEQKRFFKNKCQLYNDRQSFVQRMMVLKDIFESEKSGSAFWAIDYFLRNNEKEVIEGQGRRISRFIRKNKLFSEKFHSYYEHLNFLPYIKLVYLNVLEQFQWIDSFDLKMRVKKDLLELIKTPSAEAYITLYLLLTNNQIRQGEVYISKEDLPADYIQNIWGLLIFQHLMASAPEWQFDIMKYCKDHIEDQESRVICHQVLLTLADIGPKLETAQAGVPFLNHEDEKLVYYTISMLGQSGIQDELVHRKIAYFLTHENSVMREEAFSALGYLRTPYKDVQRKIASLLSYADEALARKLFWSFSRMDIKSKVVQNSIIQYGVNNKSVMEKAFKAFEKTSEFFADDQKNITDLLFHAVGELVENIFLILGNMNIKSEAAQNSIVEYALAKKDNKFLMTKAFGAFENTSQFFESVQDRIIKLLFYADEQLVENIFWSFQHIDIRSKSVQDSIIEYASELDNTELIIKVFKAFESSSQFSNKVLGFFYDHLDSRDDRTLALVESLSRNEKLRDWGIYFRFVEFHKEESVAFKKEVLKRMISLTWMHPRTQLSFLFYLRDESTDVRKEAVHVLRNIRNLEDETKKSMEDMYRNEKIEELKVFYPSL